MAKKKSVDVSGLPDVFRDRIKELVRLDPAQIEANPKNWRHHSPQQAAELKKIMAKIGIADVAIVFLTPEGKYRLIDGHLRSKTIKQKIPAIVLDVDEKEASELLLSLDPIASMAQADEDQLEKLIQEINPDELLLSALNEIPLAAEQEAAQAAEAIQRIADTSNEDILNNDIVELSSAASTPIQEFHTPTEGSGGVITDVPQDVIDRATAPDPFEGVLQLREFVCFPSSNRYGIPDLRHDMLSTVIPQSTWGGNAETMVPGKPYMITWANAAIPPEAAGSVLNFYCDDYKFESVWNSHVQLVERIRGFRLGGVITADFSTYWKLPLIVKMYNQYRSRWLGRYWQEAGIKIIPSLSRSGLPDHAAEDCAGMPKNPPIVSTQCRTMGKTIEEKEEAKMIWLASTNRQIQILEPVDVLIYGGFKHRQWLEPALTPGPRYHYLEAVLDVRQRLMPTLRAKKAKKKGEAAEQVEDAEEANVDE